MRKALLSYAYLCTPPCDKQVVVWGRLTGGPYELTWTGRHLSVGAALALTGFQPMPYTGFTVQGGLVADWGDSMCVIFSNADLADRAHPARFEGDLVALEPYAQPAFGAIAA